jgi:hypothetical protein
MKRLAIYAHYGNSPLVAGYVLFYLQHILELGFEICFVSNSELSPASETQLKQFCERVIVRENTGLDFSMWQRGLAEYDLLQFDELFLTNSSIIGPVQPLAPLWQNPALADCDFWGLTDNNEMNQHLQSYFLVFRKPVIQSPRFAAFWRSVLPYQNKLQVVHNYEIGLTCWLEEGGFKWKAAYPQADVWRLFKKKRGLARTLLNLCFRPNQKPLNSTLYAPDILLQCGMPFVKVALLNKIYCPANDRRAFAWLKNARLPAEIQKALESHLPV